VQDVVDKQVYMADNDDDNDDDDNDNNEDDEDEDDDDDDNDDDFKKEEEYGNDGCLYTTECSKSPHSLSCSLSTPG